MKSFFACLIFVCVFIFVYYSQLKTTNIANTEYSGKCCAKTNSGKSCKRNATNGIYCWQHAK